MSRYVVLIKTDCQKDGKPIYALTVSSNPANGLASLQSYCPTACTLIHTIESASRTEDLERTLHIKFAPERLRPKDFWFTFSPDQIEFIQSINAANLTRVSGLIKRQLAPPPPPVIPTDELPDYIGNAVELCQNLLQKK